MRIRMLTGLTTKAGTFVAGQAYEVEDGRARSWIGFHFAEQDKMIDAAPETKQAAAPPAPGIDAAALRRGAQVHSGPNVTLEVFQGTAKTPPPPPGQPARPARKKA